MTAAAADDLVLRPFRRSRNIRHAYLDRTRRILSALDDHAASSPGGTVLALPDIVDNDDEDDDDAPRKSLSSTTMTSHYVLRPPTKNEYDALFDPTRCGNRPVNENDVVDGGSGASTAIYIMYLARPGCDNDTDASDALIAQYRKNRLGGRVVLGVRIDRTNTSSSSIPATAPSSTSSSSSSPGATAMLGDVIGVTNNGLVRDSILEPECAVHANVEISDTHVMSRASVIGCGTISCPTSDVKSSREVCNFDMRDGSMDVEFGPEAGGGRVCNIKVECTMIDVCRVLNMDAHGGDGARTRPSLLLDPTSMIPTNEYDRSGGGGGGGGVGDDEAHDATTNIMNVLCPHSSVRHTPRVRHVHLLPHSSIDSATSVISSILLPRSSVRDGSTAMNALLQWNSNVTSNSDVRRVVLMERAEVGPHSLTANSAYGPDSHVSGGEVHCTLFGPNANSHHQSLLIGILWPLGRGNVGYGSNVGSNHTGRIPDQETSVGEGTFWGLGCVIKFPVDLTSAPYSIIAAGVQLPPQRITFPFSLITDGPGGMNQLSPGWLLHYSPYTIARSEVKFANRRTARRHDFYTGWKILRAGVMDMISDARDALVHAGNGRDARSSSSSAVGGDATKIPPYRTDRAIVGLGANQLTEQGRLIGIRAYNAALQRYALRGLLDRLVKLAIDTKGSLIATEALRRVGLGGGIPSATAAVVVAPTTKPTVNWPVLPWNEASHSNDNESWEHQRRTLLRELPTILLDVGGDDGNAINGDDVVLSALLRKCVELETDHAKRVYDSKSRDDVRGAATVPGYGDVHINAERDPVVLMTRKEADDVRRDVRMVEDSLVGIARSRL